MSQFLPFLLFAFVASITPGPTNILVFSSSAQFGLPVALRLALGGCAGAALVVWLVGLGLGEVLLGQPQIQRVMTWLGVAWISYLAWQLFRAPAHTPQTGTTEQPVGALIGAGLQWVNPKTWTMALAVVSVFAGQHASATQYALYALLFFVVACPCMVAWALLGRGVVRQFKSARAWRRFNQGMALLLLGSAWLSVLL